MFFFFFLLRFSVSLFPSVCDEGVGWVDLMGVGVCGAGDGDGGLVVVWWWCWCWVDRRGSQEGEEEGRNDAGG